MDATESVTLNYTRLAAPLPRLRAYLRELNERYEDALRRHDLAAARSLSARRRRVRRAILLTEEWRMEERVERSALEAGEWQTIPLAQ